MSFHGDHRKLWLIAWVTITFLIAFGILVYILVYIWSKIRASLYLKRHGPVKSDQKSITKEFLEKEPSNECTHVLVTDFKSFPPYLDKGVKSRESNDIQWKAQKYLEKNKNSPAKKLEATRNQNSSISITPDIEAKQHIIRASSSLKSIVRGKVYDMDDIRVPKPKIYDKLEVGKDYYDFYDIDYKYRFDYDYAYEPHYTSDASDKLPGTKKLVESLEPIPNPILGFKWHNPYAADKFYDLNEPDLRSSKKSCGTYCYGSSSSSSLPTSSNTSLVDLSSSRFGMKLVEPPNGVISNHSVNSKLRLMPMFESVLPNANWVVDVKEKINVTR